MSSLLVRVPHLKLNTIVYQFCNNFKDYSFDIILGTLRKLPLVKCGLPNNIRTPDVKKDQSLQVD